MWYLYMNVFFSIVVGCLFFVSVLLYFSVELKAR